VRPISPILDKDLPRISSYLFTPLSHALGGDVLGGRPSGPSMGPEGGCCPDWDARSDFLCMCRLAVLTGMSGNLHLEDFACNSNLNNLPNAGKCSGCAHDVGEFLFVLALYMKAVGHSTSLPHKAQTRPLMGCLRKPNARQAEVFIFSLETRCEGVCGGLGSPSVYESHQKIC
jgi:hypothetical protein